MNTQRFTSLRPSIDIPEMFASRQAPQKAEDGDNSWYTIRNVSKNEVEVFIYDFIGAFGVSANEFIRELGDIKAQKISLRINSPGGDVFDGIAIYNALARHSAEVTVFVDGIAASAASFIAMAGDAVVMSPHAQMMIHDAQGFAMGPAEEMRKLADILDGISNNIASIYARKAGGSTEEWRAKMLAETWLSDRESVDMGLADSILGESDETVAARMAARIDNVNEPIPEPEPEPQPEPEPAPVPVTPVAIDWKAVFQEAVEMAEDDLFVPVEEAV